MIHESAVFHSKHSTVWVIVDMAHNDDRMAPKSVQNLGGMATALALPHQKKKLLRPWGSHLVQFTLFHHQPLSFFVLHAIIHYKPVSFIMKPSKVFIIHHCHYHSFTNYILLWLPSGKHTNSHGKHFRTSSVRCQSSYPEGPSFHVGHIMYIYIIPQRTVTKYQKVNTIYHQYII